MNTSPALVAKVIRELSRAQPKEIILADAAAIGRDTRNCLEAGGIGTAASGAQGVCRWRRLKRIVDRLEINQF